MNLPTADIESIERATLAAVAPERVEELPGWLLPMDPGTVGRAHAAAPLVHDPAGISAWHAVAERYRACGYRPVFRLPEVAAFAGVRTELASSGWRPVQPTQVQVASVSGLLGVDGAGCSLDERPDAAWKAMFLGAGLDPVDGASRAAALARAQHSLYASWRTGERVSGQADGQADGQASVQVSGQLSGQVSGETRACGLACFAQGWLSVHGMRTAAAYQGQGLATRVLAAMALEAQRRGIDRVFLQVDAANTAALALYRRLSFAQAWTYTYWRPSA